MAGPSIGERGQPVKEVGPIAIVVAVEVTPSAPSSILEKTKRDNAVGPSGHKKSKAHMSLRALRQAAGLMPIVGHPSTVQDVPLAPPIIEFVPGIASTPVTSSTPAPSPTSTVVEAVVPTIQVDSIVASSSTIVAPLLSGGVATTGAPTVLPPSSTSPVASPSTVLAVVASPISSSRPHISLYHLYTSSDADSLWGTTYKTKQKIPVVFVSAFDKNLIRLAEVQNATDSVKVFLQ